MGSFNHKCNFSQLPAKYGDRIVVLVGVRMTSNVLDADGFSPGGSFTPVSVPIRGKYNDYGGIDNVDRTPGIEALEKYFNMSVERIVDCAERITCGCENQLNDEEKKNIKVALDSVQVAGYYKEYNLVLSYIMEHESIFDDLIAINDSAIKDRYHWRIPHKYLESLGYSKNVVGKDNNYEIIMWEHDSLPKLKEKRYVWKVEEFNDYSKTSHTLSALCERIGCSVPEKYNERYYEERFKADIEFLKEKEQHAGDLDYMFRYSSSRDEYSFLRHAEFSLFRGYDESLKCGGYLLSSLGPNDAHMKLDYMKEVIEVALLYDAMYKLQMTWGNTNYYCQDIDYGLHVRFLEKCLSLAKEKVKEEEEYD